ncbi:MAG: ABC transporter ATP-binding protein [Burkholderiales bacterium]|nr:ABC transporter ATP-binding protein [Burkholderiales bacterium]
MASTTPFLSVRNLRVGFGPGGVVETVRGVSFDLEAGKTLCIVGESGCGKSVTAISIMGLHAPGTAVVSADRLRLDGHELLTCDRRELARMRGPLMSMIFQDPMSSLNPVLSIGFQIQEALTLHEKLSRKAARARVLEVLERVRIPDPAARMQAYPHQLSGGMRQRIMIAMALICRPKLLIADEPTTALDVTVQAQILWLLSELQREFGTAIVFITHDLGVVAEIADEAAVMYAGRIVERAAVGELFEHPAHGYTAGLLGATAHWGSKQARATRLVEIRGQVPPISQIGAGCAFAPRCAYAVAACGLREPPLGEVACGHLSACDQLAGGLRAEASAP